MGYPRRPSCVPLGQACPGLARAVVWSGLFPTACRSQGCGQPPDYRCLALCLDYLLSSAVEVGIPVDQTQILLEDLLWSLPGLTTPLLFPLPLQASQLHPFFVDRSMLSAQRYLLRSILSHRISRPFPVCRLGRFYMVTQTLLIWFLFLFPRVAFLLLLVPCCSDLFEQLPRAAKM